MTFEADLKSHLSAAGVVYPVVMPAGTALPVITYSIAAQTPTRDLDGDGVAGDLEEIRAQVDCWARDFDAARALARAVRARLLTDATHFKASLNSEQTLYEDNTRLHRVLLDYSFWYRTN